MVDKVPDLALDPEPSAAGPRTGPSTTERDPLQRRRLQGAGSVGTTHGRGRYHRCSASPRKDKPIILGKLPPAVKRVHHDPAVEAELHVEFIGISG